MRRTAISAVIAGLLAALTASCGSSATAGAPISWAPRPVQSQGLSVLASAGLVNGKPELALHTQHGDVTFWGGVNLGTTTPGHNPGELALPRALLRQWFPQMAGMGIRFIRVYTIMPPAFYEELAAYDEAHATAPLYLVQGIYLPDESYAVRGTLFDQPADSAFSAEIADASAAVHGTLVRPPQLGRAYGTWTADVHKWVAAWIVGAELSPYGVARTDSLTATQPFHGTYFTSTPDSTPTERWYARHMDELATAEAAHHVSAPIAFVNWPTTDPLAHPVEPNPSEDMVSLDANHVRATAAWPGGTFASYHAYPYYPDFLRFEPDLQRPLANGRTDAYLAYVTALQAHHAQVGMPTLVSEFGVPSSLGSAHYGTNGRDQGMHTEAQAMAMDAQMMRGLKRQGLSGGFLFIWADEWFKFTWNTLRRTTVANAERRSLWHDPLTNEQWFGILAMDPLTSGWSTPYERATGPLRTLSVEHDAAYVYLELKLAASLRKPLTLGFDIVPGGRSLPTAAPGAGANDVAITVDPKAGTSTAYVVRTADPILLDGLDPASIPAATLPGWDLERLTANRAAPAIEGLSARPAEFVTVGNMIRGSWDLKSRAYDSLATWWLQGSLLELRIPWSMLMFGDPSSHTAVVPVNGEPSAVPAQTIGLLANIDSRNLALPRLRWDGWNQAKYTVRVKRGAGAMASAWHAVNAG